MNNLEKIEIISKRIDNLNIHIDILTKDISNYPDDDVVGKPTRQNVLNDFILKKQALLEELSRLA